MSHNPPSKRLLAILAALSLTATLAVLGYFYLQEKKPVDDSLNKLPPVLPKPVSALAATANAIKLPAPAEVLTELFGIKTTTNKIANAADQISSVWFSQEFLQKQNKFYAVFVKTQTIDPDSKEVISSHASSANIAVLVYQLIDKQWQLFSKQRNVGDFGSWGDVPNIKNVPTLQLSAENLAFLIEGGSSGQGYTEDGKGLFVFNVKTKTWKDLGFIQTGGDNAGACDDSPQPADSVLSACWKFTGEITLTKAGKNPNYPNLLVIHQGTTSDDNNKIIPASNRLYLFDGEQYIEEGAEAR